MRRLTGPEGWEGRGTGKKSRRGFGLDCTVWL